MKVNEMTVMKIWSNDLGSCDRKVSVRISDGRYINLWIGQKWNDKRKAKMTCIKFGKTGLMSRFFGGRDQVNRTYGTIPCTWNDIKEGKSLMMPLWNKEEQVNEPYVFKCDTEYGSITFTFVNRYDGNEDMRWIEMILGDTGKALSIIPITGTIKQTEITLPYEYTNNSILEDIIVG